MSVCERLSLSGAVFKVGAVSDGERPPPRASLDLFHLCSLHFFASLFYPPHIRDIIPIPLSISLLVLAKSQLPQATTVLPFVAHYAIQIIFPFSLTAPSRHAPRHPS